MIITPRRNLVQKALNRLGRPFAMMPFPVRFEADLEHAGDRTGVFEEIYSKNYWSAGESTSGPGSEVTRTEQYRKALLALLRARNIRSLFDAPCGDLNWMKLVLAEYPIRYEGGDISEQALALARKRCPGVTVGPFDICTDPFPDAQLWHCRDALFHLSFNDIWLALKNACRSKIEYALITTHRARLLTNLDIRTGGMRYLDLERPPFNFPAAIEYLPDFEPGGFVRYVALWPIEALAARVSDV